MKKVLVGLIVLIVLIVSVSAADFTPQGDINLRGVYDILNTTNLTFLDGTFISTAPSGGDNESWNQSLANSLYIAQANESNLNVNSSLSLNSSEGPINEMNYTWFDLVTNILTIDLTQLTSFIDTWLGTKTTDNLAEGSTNKYDNQSWNVTLADTLYVEVTGDTMTGGLTLPSMNATDNITAVIYYGNGSQLTGITHDNESWNQSLADTLYRAESWDNFTGIPHATPNNGDVTHFSWADEIYDWVIGLGYSTTVGTVTSVSAGNGLDFTTVTSSGAVTMGTPGSLTAGTSNAVTATSHTHAVSGFLESLAGDSTPQLGGYLDTNTNDIGSTSDEIENIYVGVNTRVYFGDGQEASIYYNGTALIIG